MKAHHLPDSVSMIDREFEKLYVCAMTDLKIRKNSFCSIEIQPQNKQNI